MASYTNTLSKKAEKQLDKLSNKIAAPILDAIQAMAENPRPQGHKKLKGTGGYSIRMGDYTHYGGSPTAAEILPRK